MKKILLAVCGKTPQIITETLYALWEQNNIPDAIYIITTKAGRESHLNTLLHPEHGMFYKFCNEYSIDSSAIDFDYKNIIVPCRFGNIEIEDILDEEDSSLFLKQCLEITFTLTEDESNTLIFSIAGGRKTMGASLTLAAQYYGRKQDRMYHVLVHSDFEYNPSFYYPPKTPKIIELRDARGEKFLKSTEYATVSLVNLPFFSIREQLSKDLLEKPILPDELIKLLERSVKPCLSVHIQKCQIAWQGKILNLPTAQFTLYLFFIQRKTDAYRNNADTSDEDYFLEVSTITELAPSIAALYYKIDSFQMSKDITLSNTGIISPSVENVRSYISKINKKLQNTFGSTAFEQIKIASIGKKPYTKHGISLPLNLIEIIDEVGE